jgi:hypothetical protein
MTFLFWNRPLARLVGGRFVDRLVQHFFDQVRMVREPRPVVVGLGRLAGAAPQLDFHSQQFAQQMPPGRILDLDKKVLDSRRLSGPVLLLELGAQVFDAKSGGQR